MVLLLEEYNGRPLRVDPIQLIWSHSPYSGPFWRSTLPSEVCIP